MSKRDYYDVLGLQKNASDDDIKKSYRKLAMKYHPDRVSTLSDSEKAKHEEAFKEVQEAYSILSDQQKRSMYNQYGHSVFEGGGAGSQEGFSGSYEDIFDTFGSFFGGRGEKFGGQSRHSSRGSDNEINVEISLEEAAKGTVKKIVFTRTKVCETCSGSGAKKGSSPVTCNKCNGQGQVRFSSGFFAVQQTCPSCNGNGKVVKEVCTSCRGSLFIKEKRELDVTIPAGVDTGSALRLTSEGNAGLHGSQNGDLYVHIKVKPHKLFKRKGNDLYLDVPISFTTAALGSVISIPTLDGQAISLNIPAGTQHDDILSIRDKGVKSIHGYGYGSLKCKLIVETPVKLNEKQKELLKQFEKESGVSSTSHTPKSNVFLESIKKFFN